MKPWSDHGHAEREIPEDEQLYKFVIHELKEDLRARDRMILGLQSLVKKQQELLELYGIEQKEDNE